VFEKSSCSTCMTMAAPTLQVLAILSIPGQPHMPSRVRRHPHGLLGPATALAMCVAPCSQYCVQPILLCVQVVPRETWLGLHKSCRHASQRVVNSRLSASMPNSAAFTCPS
jgi:hypothetical protein